MKLSKARITGRWMSLGMLIAFIALAAVFWRTWWPSAENWVQRIIAVNRASTALDDQNHGHLGDDHAEGVDDHAHGDHGHTHEEAAALDLSAQARRNLGLNAETVRPIALQTYRRTITVPAMVVARPGRTQIQVATPLTGVITHVHAVKGEAVEPGILLFEIRLTHEDLVRAQTDFLKTLGELDVERKELNRVKQLAETGAVARKLLLDREYAVEKLEALLKAQEEALKLHGLSDGQVERVAEDRRLLRELQVIAPTRDEHTEEELRLSRGELSPVSFLKSPREVEPAEVHTPLVIQELFVHKGQAVSAGEMLCTVADYAELFIEGHAFERDADAIAHALTNDWRLTAVFERSQGVHDLEELEFAFVANEVDVDSRTLSFYVRLPNEIIRDTTNNQGQRFIDWRYRPGQRLQLRVPVEEWPNEIVLPVEALAREGAESFVFQENGDHFDRVPVHVQYRDQSSVVIANDGSLFPGDVVAMRSAHQMQMALKNKAGGGIDPHAGHNH